MKHREVGADLKRSHLLEKEIESVLVDNNTDVERLTLLVRMTDIILHVRSELDILY